MISSKWIGRFFPRALGSTAACFTGSGRQRQRPRGVNMDKLDLGAPNVEVQYSIAWVIILWLECSPPPPKILILLIRSIEVQPTSTHRIWDSDSCDLCVSRSPRNIVLSLVALTSPIAISSIPPRGSKFLNTKANPLEPLMGCTQLLITTNYAEAI